MDNLFSADQVIGKTLFATRRINVRSLPGTEASVLFVTETGQQIGKVFSWVEKSNKVWWQIDLENNKSGWVQHNQGWYSIRALKDQGAKTVKEVQKEKEQQEKSFGEKLGDFFGPTGSFLKYAIPVGAVLIGFMLIDRLMPPRRAQRA
jgi:uncharacterized protein YgiM (DUF1202 family)